MYCIYCFSWSMLKIVFISLARKKVVRMKGKVFFIVDMLVFEIVLEMIVVVIIVIGVVGLLICVGVFLNNVVSIVIIIVLYKLAIVLRGVWVLKASVKGSVIIFVVSFLKKFFFMLEKLNLSMLCICFIWLVCKIFIW